MTKIRARYRFFRPSNSTVGFGSRNRPSTNALGAIHRWQGSMAGREFAVIDDGDEQLDAEIVCEVGDVYAGAQLDALCMEHGVQREPIA